VVEKKRYSGLTMRIPFALAVVALLAEPARALEPMPSGRLEIELRKLERLACVLYVAAHPDDENTKLIAYLANEARAHTAYLSLTRGDGGQNLLGSDLGDKLGLIRTHELLAARRIDGGEQWFTRANDFGYSKTAEESLDIWGREEILADTVWAIRRIQPDVIVSRFSVEPGFTHGHHTASAWLARDAFSAATDPNQFPEQLDRAEPWSATRLLWNTSTWFYKQRNLDFDPTGLLGIDIGVYSPLFGASYAEVAAQSRSCHKTQGFGATPELGESMEYFVHVAGDAATNDLFAGIDTTWNRVPGSEPVATAIGKAIAAFSPSQPDRAVPHLIEAHRALSALPDQLWKTRKLRDLERVIAGCLGLDLECTSETPFGVPGGEAKLTVRAVQRSGRDVRFHFEMPHGPSPAGEPATLASNQLLQSNVSVRLPADLAISQPYWLREPHGLGRFDVTDLDEIGLPENAPAWPVQGVVEVDGYVLRYTVPTTFKYNDPVRGEVNEPFAVSPPAMINLPASPLVLGKPTPMTFTARIVARADVTNGQLRFRIDDAWRVEPATLQVTARAGEEIHVEAAVIPPAEAGSATLSAELEIDGASWSRGFERIEYEHIPAQTLFPPAQARVILLDVKKAGERIGYIPGAEDAIPDALRHIGYAVDVLSESEMHAATLARYDAVVLGIRALNTNPRIGFYMPALFDYAAGGGVVLLQYNTSRELKTEAFSPYPLKLDRDRVTDENAEMRILAPDHPALNFPNRITAADFHGWVQERGLYFASSWDPAYTPIFSMNDPGEKPLEGSLLVARHGKGWFAYSGLSWFRQLPAGVPGAYRLFANMVSLGHAE
jgi:LmbE family N-acetylglucosaminyl deacetylase